MKFGVYIGRFQPFHLAHLAIVKHALEHVDKLVIVIGGYNAHGERDPFNASQRSGMIRAAIGDVLRKRVRTVSVLDHPGDDDTWQKEVLDSVAYWVEVERAITLFGTNKDASSYYLSMFPEWTFHDCAPHVESLGLRHLSGTDLRAAIARGDWLTLKAGVHPAVFAQIYDSRARGEKE